jgi:hypothetical protein
MVSGQPWAKSMRPYLKVPHRDTRWQSWQGTWELLTVATGHLKGWAGFCLEHQHGSSMETLGSLKRWDVGAWIGC